MTKSKSFNIITSGFFASVVAFPTLAADVVLQEPQVPSVPTPIIDTSQWSGFYAGIYGGYSWFDANVSGVGEAKDNAAKFGGYAGYNFEFDNNIVTGFELNGGFANAEAAVSDTTIE